MRRGTAFPAPLLVTAVVLCLLVFRTSGSHNGSSGERSAGGNGINNSPGQAAPSEDDFYASYEYEAVPGVEMTLSVSSSSLKNSSLLKRFDMEEDNEGDVEEVLEDDGLILPNPEETRFDVLPEVNLPDDSLVDTDLRDHDLIDSLMYVYYGPRPGSRGAPGPAGPSGAYGSEIVIVGSVLACAAHLLTILFVLVRRNQTISSKLPSSPRSSSLNTTTTITSLSSRCVFLHLTVCLCASNLVFVLGIYATKNSVRCQTVALLLLYLHLLTALWIFLYCHLVRGRFVASQGAPQAPTRKRHLFAFAYGLPALVSAASFAIAPDSYETRRFCFVSVQRGMMLGYMAPVSFLIAGSTILCLDGVRRINRQLAKLDPNSMSAESLVLRPDFTDDDDYYRSRDGSEEIRSLRRRKGLLKTLCLLETTFDVVWFAAVLALETAPSSYAMPVAYAVLATLLGWYVFFRKDALAEDFQVIQVARIDFSQQIYQSEKYSSEESSCGGATIADDVPLLVDSSETTSTSSSASSSTCTELQDLQHQEQQRKQLDSISTIST